MNFEQSRLMLINICMNVLYILFDLQSGYNPIAKYTIFHSKGLNSKNIAIQIRVLAICMPLKIGYYLHEVS